MNDPDVSGNSSGVVLILSGGGYRAMLFHLGTLWRLNDLGLLPKLTMISSASGGSIVSATLAARWTSLEFSNECATNFEICIASPLCGLASTSMGSPWQGTSSWMKNYISHKAQAWYRELTNGKSLADLQEGPEFVFNATNPQTGGAWQFSKRHRDSGDIPGPTLDLATVMAASATLPLLAPPSRFADRDFLTRAVAGDGAVRDELFGFPGDFADSMVLLSDADAPFDPGPRRFLENRCKGTYWDIAGDKKHSAEDALVCPKEMIDGLARLPTALNALRESEQKNLIDWGFAACDAAVRAAVKECRSAEPPDTSPHGTFYRRLPTIMASAA